MAPPFKNNRGIIMSDTSIRLIVAGIKTQTRRLLTHQPTSQVNGLQCWRKPNGSLVLCRGRCRVDERLYVRGAYRLGETGRANYRALYEGKARQKWKSPLFMPAKAARLWLLVTAVRVERVGDISEHDAIAEGIDPKTKQCPVCGEHFSWACNAYLCWWDHLHGAKSGVNSAMNPWCEAITFRKLSQYHPPKKTACQTELSVV